MKKANVPGMVYVVVDEDGVPQFVESDPEETEQCRSSGHRIVRYKFDAFVTIELAPTIKVIK